MERYTIVYLHMRYNYLDTEVFDDYESAKKRFDSLKGFGVPAKMFIGTLNELY